MEATSMRRGLVFALCITLVVSCRQFWELERANLVCPPDLPGCNFCDDVADCGSADECHAWTCKAHVCTPLNQPTRSKCSTGVCSEDPVSVCVACVDYEDCPGGQCRDHVCSLCDDGIKNGWETDVDCGGGGPCKECLGTPCATAVDCKSGFCADGTCCNGMCDEPCAYCGNERGDCTPMPKYEQDFDPVCAGANVCDGLGSCLLRAGEICLNPVDCASYRCVMNRCRKEAGEPCAFPQECVEDSCVNGVCTK
jgi:hypothetical protein